MTIDTNLNIVCNLDFSLQYLYSRDEIEAGILWKMKICFIVDSELVFFIFVVYGLLMHVLGTTGCLGRFNSVGYLISWK